MTDYTCLRAALDAGPTPADGLLHPDDCLFAQDVGPCTCGRDAARRPFREVAKPDTIRAPLAERDRLAAALTGLIARCDAVEELLACFRLERRPSNATFAKLDRTADAEATARTALDSRP